MNEKLAKEWLIKSWHNLSTAHLLTKSNHYTDVIAVELHYSCEKSLKSFIAYQNMKIPKTHDLLDLYKQVNLDLSFGEEEFDLLDEISKYHIEASYPSMNKYLPELNKIKEVLQFTDFLFITVCQKLNISKESIINE